MSFLHPVGSRILVLMVFLTAVCGQESRTTIGALSAARELLHKGDFRGAASAFQGIIAARPSPEAYAGLVQSLLKLDDVRPAEQSSRKAVEAFPQSAASHAARGDVYFRQGLMPEAENEYKIALKMDSQCARAWLGQGKMEATLARDQRAGEAVTRAHELDPGDGDALYEWAVRQPYPANVAALEKHLSEFRSDPEIEGHERDYVELLKALAGRKVWVLAPEVARSELKLESLAFGGNFAPRGLGLRVRFNDRATATLLLDTGASGVTITRKFAEKIGAQKLADQTMTGAGKTGAARGYQAWIDKVSTGDLEFHDCYVHVVSNAIAESDGVIGADVFAKFLITLDFAGRKMRLDPLPEPSAAGVPTPAGPLSATAPWTQAYGFGHFLLVPADLNGKVSGLFALDSGANVNSVSPELGQRVAGMRTRNTAVTGASGTVNSAQSADINLRFAGVQRDVLIITVDLGSVSKNLGTEVSGQIGFNTLDRMKITINYRDALVGFEFASR
jgi:tetratricopeptide (TPR) repeat protein